MLQLWTIDLGLFNATGWLRTAGRFETLEEAIETYTKLPTRDCYGRHVIYRARPCDDIDREYDAMRARVRRSA